MKQILGTPQGCYYLHCLEEKAGNSARLTDTWKLCAEAGTSAAHCQSPGIDYLPLGKKSISKIQGESIVWMLEHSVGVVRRPEPPEHTVSSLRQHSRDAGKASFTGDSRGGESKGSACPAESQDRSHRKD